LLTALVGCTEPKQVVKDRARISGSVTFNGQPLPAGTIGFQSTESSVTTAASIRDGVYTTDRAPLGKGTVTVDTASIQFGNPAKYVPIPAKYGDSTTSGLTVDVHAGDNENIDFVLEK
jgi:hypothetical protein